MKKMISLLLGAMIVLGSAAHTQAANEKAWAYAKIVGGCLMLPLEAKSIWFGRKLFVRNVRALCSKIYPRDSIHLRAGNNNQIFTFMESAGFAIIGLWFIHSGLEDLKKLKKQQQQDNITTKLISLSA